MVAYRRNMNDGARDGASQTLGGRRRVRDLRLLGLALLACAGVPLGVPRAMAGHAMTGLAAFYSDSQTTASGERFNKSVLTAAHRTLPFGTRVRVTRRDTGQSVVVRINDRGPFGRGRVIDLSERAARSLNMTGRGVAPVRLDVVKR